MLRILSNPITLSPANGIDLRAFQTLRALAARGHRVSVIAQQGGDLEPAYRRFCHTVDICPDFVHAPLSPAYLRRPVHLARWGRRLGRAVAVGRALRPDVVYANDDGALPWAVATAGLVDARIVCHLPNHLGRPIGRQRALYARRVSAFVVASDFARHDWSSNGLPAARVHMVPNGVDGADYPPGGTSQRATARRALGLPDAAFVALFLGRVVPDKGVHVLVEAWRQLGLGPDEGRLLVVGPTYPPAYGEQLRRAAPAGCHFLAMRADVVTPLHAADVVVVPSIWNEPFGRVVIEAMATGCPVVASRTGGIPEILSGPFASFLVAPGDARALAGHLSSMIGWRARCPELSDACVAHVRRDYALSSVVDRLEQILVDVAAR